MNYEWFGGFNYNDVCEDVCEWDSSVRDENGDDRMWKDGGEREEGPV